jgi:hypothetical protein
VQHTRTARLTRPFRQLLPYKFGSAKYRLRQFLERLYSSSSLRRALVSECGEAPAPGSLEQLAIPAGADALTRESLSGAEPVAETLDLTQLAELLAEPDPSHAAEARR